jgi:hypothetical protein
MRRSAPRRPAAFRSSLAGAGRRPTLPARLGLLLLLLATAGGCQICDPDDLNQQVPNLTVTPEEVTGRQGGVAQDTLVSIRVQNLSAVPLSILEIELSDSSDPAFEIVSYPGEIVTIEPGEGEPYDVWNVDAGGQGFVGIKVRPRVLGEISATLRIRAEDSTLPEPEVLVPITVEGIDLGLPDITVTPDAIDFERVGQGDVVRAEVTIRNDGIRDLIIDSTEVMSDEDPTPILQTVGIPAGWALAPQQEIIAEFTFRPLDTDPHEAVLIIQSNDPDEPVVEVPLSGAGSECPNALAELLEDPEDIEPLDTVRLDGRGSTIGTPDTEIVTYEWQLEQRPVSSTAILFSPGADRTEMTCDLAGDYQVRLRVYDSEGIRSCEDSVVRFTAKPTEELHLQLVWDHPSADLDLHVLREGGEPFDHDGDCYFSNRMPDWFPTVPESNPSLDADDDEGYGPENVNIEAPIPGSKWTVLVHYWNKQTDGDAFTIATLRLYAFGQQVLDLNQSFEEDETMWTAIEIEWGMEEGELPSITQLGQVEPYSRPF